MKQFAIKAIGLLTLLLAFGWLQAQKSESANPLTELNSNPAGYDAAKETWVGTHPAEYAAMNQATVPTTEAKAQPWGAAENKDRWISENPRAYAELTAKAAETRTVLTKEQLATFPAEKQAAILKDANFLIIE